jgi:hypothetical protein
MARRVTGGQSNKPDMGWAGRQDGASVEATGRSHQDNGEKLHPSWAAKKAMKEKESIVILPSQGKKIKFD